MFGEVEPSLEAQCRDRYPVAGSPDKGLVYRQHRFQRCWRDRVELLRNQVGEKIKELVLVDFVVRLFTWTKLSKRTRSTCDPCEVLTFVEMQLQMLFCVMSIKQICQ